MKGRTRASTRERALTAENTSLQSSATLLDSLLSCGLADPFAGPYHFLTPPCDVVPRVSFDPIRTRATGDVVLAPIYRTYIVLATPTLAFVLAATKAQHVGTAPCVDAVSATIAEDSVTIRGANKGVRSVIALDGSR